MPKRIGFGLTDRERRACELYLSNGYHQQNAYSGAGYAKRANGKNEASRLFAKPHIKEYIKKKMEQLSAKTMLSAERVLEEMARIAFSDLASFYKYSETKKRWVIKSLDEMTNDQKACISEYKPGEYIKLYDKGSALDKLGKHFKLYTEIDATVNNLVIMPELKISGKEVIFEVGKPAPKITVGGKKSG